MIDAPGDFEAPAADEAAYDDATKAPETVAVGLFHPGEVILDEMPHAFYLKESDSLAYNPYVTTPVGDASLVHGQYRAVDRPRFRTVRATDYVSAIVMFNGQANHAKRNTTLGYMVTPGADAEEKEKVTLRVSFLTATQFTGICIRIHRPSKCDVFFKVFGPSIKHDKEDSNQKIMFAQQQMTSNMPDDVLNQYLCKHPQLTETAKADNLLVTRFRVWSSEEVLQASGRTRPSFQGITDTELADILQKYDDKDARAFIRDDELAVALLSRGHVFTVFRRIDKHENKSKETGKEEARSPAVTPATAQVSVPAITVATNDTELQVFLSYMAAAMWLNTWHGTLWFYKLQAPGLSLMDDQFPLNNMLVPRWLVKKWVATPSIEHKIECLPIPWEWMEFATVLEYPDAESCAFLASLAITREAEYNKAMLARMVNSKQDGDVRARFRQSPTLRDQYLVELFVPGKVKESGWAALKPAIDSRIKIKVLDKGLAGIFYGQVMDDIFNKAGSSCDIVAVRLWSRDGLPGNKSNGRGHFHRR